MFYFRLNDGKYIESQQDLEHNTNFAAKVTKVSQVEYQNATKFKPRLDLTLVGLDGFMGRVNDHHTDVEYSVDGDYFVVEQATNDKLQALFLEYSKCVKNLQIDKKTRSLIGQGFAFGGYRFSLSDTAQRNWMAIRTAVSMGDLPLPVAVSTIDDQEYTLTTETDVRNFFLTGIGTVKYHYTTGRTLKLQVDAQTDSDAVSLIEDNR